MKPVTVYTIADERFLPGLAGLINSLRASGFEGPIVVGAPARLPALDGVTDVHVVALGDDPMWIGCLKPSFLLREAKGAFIFLDADIVVDGDDVMTRLGGLGTAGFAVALEGLVAPSDHRRRRWVERLGSPVPRTDAWAYYNCGFIAGDIDRDRAFLNEWDRAIRRVLPASGGHFEDADFPFPEQDVMNALLQSSTLPVVSLQFPDWWSAVAPLNPFLHVGGLSRTALFHCIGAKPWDLKNVPPRSPSPYEERWHQHVIASADPVKVDCALSPEIRRWLAGSWSGRLVSRGTRLRQRLRGR